MKYTRFEQLPVWQAAVALARDLYAFTKQHKLPTGLRAQIERATLSISNNVAEGFERGTNSDLLTFLYIARGSAAEVRSMLCVLETLPEFQDAVAQIAPLKAEAEQISRQLRAWAGSLQESPIKGQRYLSEAARIRREEEGVAEEFVGYEDEKLLDLRFEI